MPAHMIDGPTADRRPAAPPGVPHQFRTHPAARTARRTADPARGRYAAAPSGVAARAGVAGVRQRRARRRDRPARLDTQRPGARRLPAPGPRPAPRRDRRRRAPHRTRCRADDGRRRHRVHGRRRGGRDGDRHLRTRRARLGGRPGGRHRGATEPRHDQHRRHLPRAALRRRTRQRRRHRHRGQGPGTPGRGPGLLGHPHGRRLHRRPVPGPAPAEPFAGPRSLWGARLARAVHAAVLEGALRQS